MAKKDNIISEVVVKEIDGHSAASFTVTTDSEGFIHLYGDNFGSGMSIEIPVLQDFINKVQLMIDQQGKPSRKFGHAVEVEYK